MKKSHRFAHENQRHGGFCYCHYTTSIAAVKTTFSKKNTSSHYFLQYISNSILRNSFFHHIWPLSQHIYHADAAVILPSKTFVFYSREIKQKNDKQLFNGSFIEFIKLIYGAFVMVFSITHRRVNFTKVGFCSMLRYFLRKSLPVICPVTIWGITDREGLWPPDSLQSK